MVLACMSVTLKTVMRCIHSQLQPNGEKGALRSYSRQQPFPEGIICTHIWVHSLIEPLLNGIKSCRDQLSNRQLQSNAIDLSLSDGKSNFLSLLCAFVWNRFTFETQLRVGTIITYLCTKTHIGRVEKEDYEPFSSTKKEESHLKTLTKATRVWGVSVWT